MTLTQKFANNVKQFRAKKKLSQTELAKRVGISVSYVSMLERAVRSPPLETIEVFSRVTKLTPAQLLS